LKRRFGAIPVQRASGNKSEGKMVGGGQLFRSYKLVEATSSDGRLDQGDIDCRVSTSVAAVLAMEAGRKKQWKATWLNQECRYRGEV
jgi:hypothetical protein